jgi:aspartokinase/homoserine dehydrogenase 1
LNATDLEIWTDVNGMFTANPKIVKQVPAFISYQEAMELSFWCESFVSANYTAVLKKNIPILIKNTFEPEAENINFQQMDFTNPVKELVILIKLV